MRLRTGRILLLLLAPLLNAACTAFSSEKSDDMLAPVALLLATRSGPSQSPACSFNSLAGANQACPLVLSGVVSALAGPAQGTVASGDTDATGTAARFNAPQGVTTDGSNLFLAEAGNNKIRRIVISTGVVTTLAGPAQGFTTLGDTDATGNAARFDTPAGITTDGTNLFVADRINHKIRKVVIATGVVTTLAGPAQGTAASGDTDATGNSARFCYPCGITTDSTNLFVAEACNHKIRKVVISTGAVTTLAGPAQGSTASGDTDATGNSARFYNPCGIATDGTNLFVADSSNNKIRKVVISTGAVTTLAGPAQGSTASGDTDATGNSARFAGPANIITDGSSLFVVDSGNHKVRKVVTSTGVVTTLVGPAQGTAASGDTDAAGTSARFYLPSGITTDGISLFVNDAGNSKVRKIR